MNPYAEGIPGASHEDVGQGILRSGDTLAMNRFSSQLPDRCVVCNAPAGGYRVHKTFYWHPPEYYLTIFLGVLIYAIVAMVTRKEARVAYGLCPEHKKRRQLGIAIGWVGFVGGFAGMIAVPAADLPMVLVLVALAILIASPIVGAVMSNVIKPKRIDERTAFMKVGAPFLASIPAGDPAQLGMAQGFGGMGQAWGPPGYGMQTPYGAPQGWGPQQGYGQSAPAQQGYGAPGSYTPPYAAPIRSPYEPQGGGGGSGGSGGA